MKYAHVLIEFSTYKLDKTFLYEALPETKRGMRVYVPFGRGGKLVEGIVLKVEKLGKEEALKVSCLKDIKKIKKISANIDSFPIYNDEMISLGLYMAKRYIAGLNLSFKTMLPKGFRLGSFNEIKPEYEKVYSLLRYEFNNKTQKEIVDYLKDVGVSSKRELSIFSSSSLNTLVKKRIIKEERVLKDLSSRSSETMSFNLNEEQRKVFEDIKSSKEAFHLLHGVTGSGKTLIYISLIKDAVDKGKTAILLLPEIALTMQTVSFFKKYFSNDIAVIHSGLNQREQFNEYLKIYKQDVKVVLGARSAIFAPLKNLGLIIVDEAHSKSFIQDASLKYHAIEIAQFRTKYNKGKLVLGTATPDVSTYYLAEKGKLELHRLKSRFNKGKLKTEVIDLKKHRKSHHFSDILLDKIKENLEKNKQVIIFLNRRGYERFAECYSCGASVKCPNCDISLVYYKSDNTLRCSACFHSEKYSKVCPHCKEESLDTFGVGTEKIKEELLNLFPGVKVLRLDSDVAFKKGEKEKLLKTFKNKEADILVGTEMISKGLDFEDLELVGVINADTSLNLPTYLASEETFATLIQTMGRGGRGSNSGEVIIQTFNPENYAIRYALNQDYPSFYEEEIKIRKALDLPPFKKLLQLNFRSKNKTLLQEEILGAKNYLLSKNLAIEILGPNLKDTFKLNKVYHLNLLLKYNVETIDLYKALFTLSKRFSSHPEVRLHFYFSPYMV